MCQGFHLNEFYRFLGKQVGAKGDIVQVHPPWGVYFGVVSQSVTTATARSEVEVTVVTDQQMFEKVAQGDTNGDLLQQHVLYVQQHKQLHDGENTIQLYVSLLTVQKVSIFCEALRPTAYSVPYQELIEFAGRGTTKSCSSLSMCQWAFRSSMSKQIRSRLHTYLLATGTGSQQTAFKSMRWRCTLSDHLMWRCRHTVRQSRFIEIAITSVRCMGSSGIAKTAR